MKNLNLHLILFIISLCFYSTSIGQAIEVTDSMSIPRVLHQMQPLPDGRVLVFGGVNNAVQPGWPHYESSSEIYDPATGLWTITDSMKTARSDFSSVVTTAGKVLAVGGLGDNGIVTEVESFDPVTETWSVVGNCTCNDAAVILLDNGDIFAAGNPSIYQGSPDGSVWEDKTPSPDPIWNGENISVLRMNNSKLLVFGDHSKSFEYGVEYTQTLIADTTFRKNKAQPSNRAILMNDGKVLVGGGFDHSVEIYDPTTRMFSQAQNVNRILGSPFMLMSDGRVAAMTLGDGGLSGGDDYKILEIYDPAMDTWTPIGPHAFPPTQAANMAPLGNGKFLLAGGVESGMFLNSGSKASFIFDENGTTSVGIKKDLRNNSLSLIHVADENKIRLEGEEKDIRKIKNMTLLDMTGRTVYSASITNADRTILLPENPHGLYLVQLNDEFGRALLLKKIML